MKELSKSIPRRMRDPNFVRRYFAGDGVDIGGRPDPLSLYRELFPLMGDVRIWDLEDGDAQLMSGVADETYDFVHSSHCLEHLRDPEEGLRNWLRIVKPDGFLIITGPDEDLYEQGVFPSSFNADHKWTLTLHKERSWSPRSINLLGLLTRLGPQRVEKIELLTDSYRFAAAVDARPLQSVSRRLSADEALQRTACAFFERRSAVRRAFASMTRVGYTLALRLILGLGAPPIEQPGRPPMTKYFPPLSKLCQAMGTTPSELQEDGEIIGVPANLLRHLIKCALANVGDRRRDLSRAE